MSNSTQTKKFTFVEILISIFAIIIVGAIVFFLLGKRSNQANFNGSDGSFVLFQTKSSHSEENGPIGTWTTDQPLSYSPIVTMVFIDAASGVKYEMENKNVMAIGFTYKVTDRNTLQLTYKDGSRETVPFRISGDRRSLTLTFDGKPIVFAMDFQDKASLKNTY